jgi:hypothetical protein
MIGSGGLLNNRQIGDAVNGIAAPARHPHENWPHHGDVIRLDVKKKPFGPARARAEIQNLNRKIPYISRSGSLTEP